MIVTASALLFLAACKDKGSNKFEIEGTVKNATASVVYLEEASISLGVPPGRSVLKVVLPLMLPSIATAAVLMWSTTLSELSASIVVYGGGLETLPIAIFRLIDGGRMGQASAYGLVLVLLIVVPIFLAVKFGRLNLFASK